MGNSYAGQLKTTRFEEVLHNSIEASLRSNNLVPRPVFSQLYLEAEQQLTSVEAGSRPENEEEEEDDGSESNSPPIPYQMKPPPDGCCTTDGFCQAGKDLRLASISNEQIELPAGFLLVGAKSPNLLDHLLVCAVDKRFLPDDNGRNALLGFSGNCVGCGEKGFRYFTEFSNHINLKLTTQPKKQKHLKYYLVRNAQGVLTKGPLICWKGTECRGQQSTSSTCSSAPSQPPESPSPLMMAATESVSLVNQNASAGSQQTGIPTDQALPVLTSGTPTTLNGKDSPKHQHSVKSSNLSMQMRPSVIGTLANSGPPKKRHKGWSPESPSATEAGGLQSNQAVPFHGNKADGIGLTCLSQPVPAGLLPSPLAATGEPVSVPDNLLKISRTRPVILKGHGNFPYFCGNLNDIIVSPLLQTCYKNAQSLPRAYEQYGASPIQPLSVEMQILLTVYYLVQLAPDQAPLIEDLEQIFMRSWRESHLAEIRQYQQAHPQMLPQVRVQIPPVTSAQLPWLTRLAASSCNNSVHIIESTNSLAEGLSELFRSLAKGKLQQTNFVVIIYSPKNRSTESCVAVIGKHQARALAESMFSPSESLKEINYELVTGKVASLGAFFSTLCPDGDINTLLDKFHQERSGKTSSPFSISFNKAVSSEGVATKATTACTSYNTEWHQIRSIQLAVARKLLSHVCAIADSSTQNLDLGSFEKVDFLIFVPPSEVTYQQIVLHLWQSGILLEIGLEKKSVIKQRAEQYVVKMDAEAQTKFKAFLQKSLQNPYTLFVLIHDHAHWDLVSSGAPGPYPQTESYVGLIDRLLNCRQVTEAPNILILHVTSFPYALQTQQTRISPYNEIHWPSACNNGVDLYHENKKYFGLSEFIESTHTGHSLPLLRYDSSFEAMVMAVGERFPKLHSAVIRTYVLIQHYAAAMMAVSGLSQMKNYTSVETLEIIQNLINSPGQCSSSHGHMVLLRIPSVPLAAVAYERLCQVRERLGLEHHFEVILGNPNTGITIGKHFVEQLKMWQKIEDTEWMPHTYLELEALPCILIFTGMDPQGESLPRSLRYCDLRLINSAYLERTALEQELGLAAYLLRSDLSREMVVVSDLSESDPEKLSSTDFEDEEIVIEDHASAKRSPIKRQRSHSNDSASSSLSSKASNSAFSSKSSSASATENTTKSPHPSLVNSTEGSVHNKGSKKNQVDRKTQRIYNVNHSLAKEPIDCISTINKSARKPPKSTSSASSSTPTYNIFVSQPSSQCSMAKALQQPPIVFLPKAIYDIVTSIDSSGLPKSASFLPYHSVSWVSSFRPLLSKMMTCTEQSLYYRQWTVPKQIHMDYNNRVEGRTDNFHPRRLLLSGPPQVGKTGAYLQFLSILSRMLIRLMEVDVYDEQEISINMQEESAHHYHQPGALWPDLERFKKMPFDYTVHDPNYEDASPVFSKLCNLESKEKVSGRKQEDIYLRRHTTRMRLSKYAAYNTYHHCEQCHQYMGFSPRYQPYESTLHAFAFSYSMLGEEIQLHFIIPKSKEHHFVFSQPGGQLESMRLPLVTDKNPDYIKTPIFTPTSGRHEHGLFNLYHAMDGATHLHILVVKEYEMAVYKKYWPNHIMLVLPSIFNTAGVGAAHFLIKELSYHNLELERNRQEELGVKPQDIWPFIAIADDSCVMWNVVDFNRNREASSEDIWTERNVSLKHVMQRIEETPNVIHYALLGMRKWSNKESSKRIQEPFSRCHLHDFILLNVDLTQNVQYKQNRFTCDDVDFNLRAHSAGLLICRFNCFSVMKKQIAIGGHRTFHIKSKVPDVSTSVSPSQYICAPDSKHTFLAAPAQLLLEKHLQYTSHCFFPLSLKNYNHPVLCVDCYLNLGAEISVCYVSSRPHSLNINCSGLEFSGLLLYLCDSFVTASFLKNFHFMKDATLCVICQDRSSLRQTVVRLELEDEWQFRLRDEFQTANSKEDRPLFLLTGRHI
ncbi:protein GREB1 [Latimeria chalumnae]|uniref:protein GREB1 n=1 Tax=Latimeria chalumnae TaxID=7897 RepID=UPI0003C1524A|nr:PREDICTED: protein GREB1 [Latimeria chalumnae]|eukprot:XP_005995991.1 PREDICTED: protein GREB1 [Latimeria chalumnae]